MSEQPNSKRDMPLDELGILSAGQVRRLEAHWITTLEQFLSLGANADRRRCGADLLAASTEDIEGLLAQARALAPELADQAVAYPYEDYLGCLAPPEDAQATFVLPAELAEAPLPDEADLTGLMAPIRDQGRRGTCVAFSCTAMREYLTARNDCDLSEQFLYWSCKQRDGYFGEGTYLHTATDALLDGGVCLEADWPYNPHRVDGNEGQGPPPPGAAAAAMEFRLAEVFCLVARPNSQTPLRPFKVCLSGSGGDSPRPVALAVPLFDSFFNQATRRTGRVTMPLPGESARGGHAMCIVGYKDDSAVPGGGFFIVRNSWGEGWAYNCDYGPGHALLPYRYIEKHCWEAYSGHAQPTARAARTTTRAGAIGAGLDYGHCSACGKRILTRLDIAGRCASNGCDGTICNTCWTAHERRHCSGHSGQM